MENRIHIRNMRENWFTYPLMAMLVMLMLTSCHCGNEYG